MSIFSSMSACCKHEKAFRNDAACQISSGRGSKQEQIERQRRLGRIRERISNINCELVQCAAKMYRVKSRSLSLKVEIFEEI